MTRWLITGLLISLGAIGCGGETDADNGAGGSATGGSAGSGAGGGTGATGGTSTGGSGGASGGVAGTGGLPNECAVPVTEPGPYPTQFEFVNPLDTPLWVRESCSIEWELYACADGYKSPIAHSGACSVDCASADNGCIACDACPQGEEQVDPGKSVTVDWSGLTYTFGQNASGCQCHNAIPALPARYAVKVFVSSNIAEAPWEQWGYFDLPAPSGVVTVSLVNSK